MRFTITYFNCKNRIEVNKLTCNEEHRQSTEDNGRLCVFTCVCTLSAIIGYYRLLSALDRIRLSSVIVDIHIYAQKRLKYFIHETKMNKRYFKISSDVYTQSDLTKLNGIFINKTCNRGRLLDISFHL